MERQIDGFLFERNFLLANSLTPSKYTDIWDSIDLYKGLPIQIKKSSSIKLEMGSLFRFIDNVYTTDFITILKVKEKIYELIFSKGIRDIILDNMPYIDYIEELEYNISSIHDFVTARNYAFNWKIKYQKGFITIAPKIDSKNQRRLQCIINKNNLLKLFSKELFNA
jgi:hypothetical protein